MLLDNIKADGLEMHHHTSKPSAYLLKLIPTTPKPALMKKSDYM